MWDLFCISARPFTGGFYILKEHLLFFTENLGSGPFLSLPLTLSQALASLFFSYMTMFLLLTSPILADPSVGTCLLYPFFSDLLCIIVKSRLIFQLTSEIFSKSLFFSWFQFTSNRKSSVNTENLAFCKNSAE